MHDILLIKRSDSLQTARQDKTSYAMEQFNLKSQNLDTSLLKLRCVYLCDSAGLRYRAGERGSGNIFSAEKTRNIFVLKPQS